MKDYELIEQIERLKKVVLAVRLFACIPLLGVVYMSVTNTESFEILMLCLGIMIVGLIFGLPKQFKLQKLKRQLQEMNK
jgi:hypothetical protein